MVPYIGYLTHLRVDENIRKVLYGKKFPSNKKKDLELFLNFWIFYFAKKAGHKFIIFVNFHRSLCLFAAGESEISLSLYIASGCVSCRWRQYSCNESNLLTHPQTEHLRLCTSFQIWWNLTKCWSMWNPFRSTWLHWGQQGSWWLYTCSNKCFKLRGFHPQKTQFSTMSSLVWGTWSFFRWFQ